MTLTVATLEVQRNGMNEGPSSPHYAISNCPPESVTWDDGEMRVRLLEFRLPCYALRVGERIGLTTRGTLSSSSGADESMTETLGWSRPLSPERLGDPAFRETYGVRYAYAAGSMANGIASEDLVIAMGRSGLLASFGAAGLPSSRVEVAIHRVQAALPEGPYAFNLIHSPSETELEKRATDLYLAHGVKTVEASAYLDLTPHLVRYRVSGYRETPDGNVAALNRVIAKVSRAEVARKFMSPPPAQLLRELVASGAITAAQARMAETLPLCDDVTAEADSGGHTDNRPLVGLLPMLIGVRDELQEHHRYATSIRIGAAGGISTPESALAAFMMGAAYVVTGSVNQACRESGASDHVKALLAQAEMTDVTMAPAADMFEMGVRVQLLKRGTLFPQRAQRLYELYKSYESVDAIPAGEREKLERQYFHADIESIWRQTVAFFRERDPVQIARAEAHPKRKMALIFRWYLGLSSRWANEGAKGREMDYQIWCGPSMGAFNAWARGTYLETPESRRAPEVARQIMRGAAYLYRVNELRMQGVPIPPAVARYRPEPMDEGEE
jgi:PfaD family protein